MDAHDYARLASVLAAERAALHTALSIFREHHVGPDWRGASASQAEASRDYAIDAVVLSLRAIDAAEDEARRLWREALATATSWGM